MERDLPTRAVIVAGGRGERLKPLTNTLPKPMVMVGNKPLLEHTLDLLKKHGIQDFIFALFYLPESIVSYFGDGSKFGANITYTYEDPQSPLGTAGAILPAKSHLNKTFIVTYADILRELNITEMINCHRASKPIATINVYRHRGLNFKSRLEFDEMHRLRKFEELPASTELKSDSTWSNGAFYILEPEILNFIPEGIVSDFGTDIFPKVLAADEKVLVYPSNNYFIDIGTPESLELARLHFS